MPIFTLIGLASLPAAVKPAQALPAAQSVIHTFNGKGDGSGPYDRLLQASDGNFYGTTYQGGTNNGGTVFQVTPAGVLTTLHSFTNTTDGASPYGGLIQATDGNLYGTTTAGGPGGAGTIFQINTAGTSFNTIHSFNSTDGAVPYSGVIQASDGKLYGVTQQGGLNGLGTVFKIGTAVGATLTTLHSFSTDTTDGYYPFGGVIQASDLNLYGTTGYGGLNGAGTVYKIGTTGGASFALRHSFNNTDGSYPQAPLMQHTDLNLYGTTLGGGSNGEGTIFKIGLSGGTTFVSRYSFTGTDGYSPETGLIEGQGADTNLYGTTSGGGIGYGNVYQISTTAGAAPVTLHSFNNTDGSNPFGGLVQGSDGNLYGMTVSGGASTYGTIYRVGVTGGATFSTLYQFGNGYFDGQTPEYGSLLLAKTDGNYYGTTYAGGIYGQGTVYRMTPAGVVTILHAFQVGAEHSRQGYNPYGGLIQGKDNNFYGTTNGGGIYGQGTVYKMTPAGVFTTLFDLGGAAGISSPAGVIQGADGNLYGVTYQGGQYGYGAVYKLVISSLPAQETVLYSFTGNTDVPGDGSFPNGGLIQAKDLKLYGTTWSGGLNGYGTVFSVTTTGTGFTTLRSLDYSNDGAYPNAGLIQGSDGFLYGTTYLGGASSVGTVFQIKTVGTPAPFLVLHSFMGTDGSYSSAPLFQASDGKLYGTTQQGGKVNLGTVFSINLAGTGFASLESFAGDPTDGRNPYAGLIEGKDGNLYGTTSYGGIAPFPGTNVMGTVYKVPTLLPLITSFAPSSAPVGATVSIFGVNLSGTTAVVVHNVVATFTNISATQVNFTVPVGATTGGVKLTTPYGVTTSSILFFVSPTITSFTPTSGPVGTVVTITGATFTGATGVKFNGVAATSFTVNSSTQITVTVPTGATTGPISVSTPSGSGTSATSYTVG